MDILKGKPIRTAFLLPLILLMLSGCADNMQRFDKVAEMHNLSNSTSWNKAPVTILDYQTQLQLIVSEDGNLVKEKETRWYRVNKLSKNGVRQLAVAQNSTIEKPVRIKAFAYYPDGSHWQLDQGQIAKHKRNYSDVIVHSFYIPKYQKDTLIHLEIVREYTKPEFLGRFLLQSVFPVLGRKITLKYPENVALVYGIENDKEVDVDESFRIEDGLKIQEIEARKLPYLQDLKRTHFPEEYYAGFYISFPPKGLESYSWQELGDHYLKLSSEAFAVSETIERLAGAIADDAPADQQVWDGFETVVGKIRYHGDWRDGHAFIPRKASVVLENGYGDCKELSTIMKSMLGVKKIESYPVLLATWGGFQPLEKYPFLGSFNHMILSVKGDGQSLNFLDGTHSWADAGSSYYPSVGRKALILEPDNSRLMVIPGASGFENRVVTSGTVEQGPGESGWVLKGKIQLNGYPALRFYEELQESSKKDAPRLARRLLKESFGIFAEDVTVIEATAQKMSVGYTADFDENYVSLGKGGLKLSIPMLYKPEVNHQLTEKLGPLYLPKFEQEDHWQLPFVPEKSELPSYSTSLADSTWQVDGQSVVRQYSQPMARVDGVDMDVREWDMHLGALKNSVVWR